METPAAAAAAAVKRTQWSLQMRKRVREVKRMHVYVAELLQRELLRPSSGSLGLLLALCRARNGSYGLDLDAMSQCHTVISVLWVKMKSRSVMTLCRWKAMMS